ncbi:hypothetical protein C8J57DRAFT_1053257 [Mycena rebaudengoi]|nr:hypothetical protein C8J57DRAFT_1053257 [Mycena rebaudengoi]
MALFQDHPIRSGLLVVAALFVAHVVSLFVSFFHIFHSTQASVAILAVAGVIFLVAQHHQRNGHLMTHTQEEMVLIFCFGLFWLCVLLGWHGLRAREGSPRSSGEMDIASAMTQVATRERLGKASVAGFRGQVRPYPCNVDDLYCVVEEYTFF